MLRLPTGLSHTSRFTVLLLTPYIYRYLKTHPPHLRICAAAAASEHPPGPTGVLRRSHTRTLE